MARRRTWNRIPARRAKAFLFRVIEHSTELRQYCYGVASVVGLVCIKSLGIAIPRLSRLLNIAGWFQLTNIIADVKEDVSMAALFFRKRIWSNSVFHPPTHRAQSGSSGSNVGEAGDRAREGTAPGKNLIPLVNEDSQPHSGYDHDLPGLLERMAASPI